MTTSLGTAFDPVSNWPVALRRIRLGAVLVSLMAVVTDGTVLILRDASLGEYVGLVVSAGAGVIVLRYPTWGVIVAVAACFVAVGVGADPTTSWTVAVFTLFSATLVAVPPLPAGLLVSATLYLLVCLHDGHEFWSSAALAAAAAAAAAAGIGGGLRAQGRYRRALLQQASDAASRAVMKERLQIARDLHDLVGHEVAALNMQIGVAEVSLPPGADLAAAALVNARVAVQSVLRETQQILQLLRQGDSPRSSDVGQPVPGFEQIPDLSESFRRLGLQVDADLDPFVGSCDDPAVGLTSYRLVQESLTNAWRYGDGSARLILHLSGNGVTLTVMNGLGPNQPAPGRQPYGLVGMQERVAAIGGSLRVTDGPDTFVVEATLPVRRASGGHGQHSSARRP